MQAALRALHQGDGDRTDDAGVGAGSGEGDAETRALMQEVRIVHAHDVCATTWILDAPVLRPRPNLVASIGGTTRGQSRGTGGRANGGHHGGS